MSLNKDNTVLTGTRLTMRPLSVDDVTEEYVDGLNDIEVNRYLVDVKRCQQTVERVCSFVEANRHSPATVLFGIFIAEDNDPLVGTIRLSEISSYHMSASVGVCLFAKRAWKKGYASEAIRLVVKYAFDILGLHYLEAGSYVENTNSRKLFSRCGFSERYRVSDKYRHESSFKDVVYLGIMNDRFDASNLR